MNIILSIQELYPSLSLQEKKIATYILNHYSDIANMKINELASLTATSAATVSRFAKIVCGGSFIDFKLALQRVSKQYIQDEISGTKTEQEIYSHYTKVITNTRNLNDQVVFDTVIKKIKRAKKIYIFGVGSSGFTAQEFSDRLMRMGIEAMAVSDPHLMLIVSSLFSKNDLLITISVSGATKEIVQSIQMSKSKNIEIISLTSFVKSEIALLSDIILLSYNSMFVDNRTFINSQFSLMYLVDTISMILLKDKRYKQNMDQTIGVIHTIQKQN